MDVERNSCFSASEACCFVPEAGRSNVSGDVTDAEGRSNVCGVFRRCSLSSSKGVHSAATWIIVDWYELWAHVAARTFILRRISTLPMTLKALNDARANSDFTQAVERVQSLNPTKTLLHNWDCCMLFSTPIWSSFKRCNRRGNVCLIASVFHAQSNLTAFKIMYRWPKLSVQHILSSNRMQRFVLNKLP